MDAQDQPRRARRLPDGERRAAVLLIQMLAAVLAAGLVVALVRDGDRGERAVLWTGQGGLVASVALALAGRVRPASALAAGVLLVGSLTLGWLSPELSAWPAAAAAAVNLAAVLLGTRIAVPLGIVAALAIPLVALHGAATISTAAAAVHAVVGLGLVAAFLGVARHRDLVEADRAREAHRRDAALAEARRLESIGRLAAGIAHDFNNLLAVVTATSSLARRRGATATLDLDAIDGATNRATGLIQQLMAYARSQPVAPRVIEVEPVITALEPLLTRLLGDGVALEIAHGAATATIEIDPGQLEQILMNLAANARDAMPRGGTLRITTCVRETTTDERSPGLGAVEIAVTDSGDGMPAEVVERIFEPFFTTKRGSRGTGLGLATVERIVTQAGGRAEVESRVGQGTVFRLRFPRAAGAGAAPREAAPVPAPGAVAVK